MQSSAWNETDATALIATLGDRQDALLPMLHALQERFGYVDARATGLIAKHLNISRAEVHGVIGFYKDFRREPPARHVLKLCQAEACQSVGARGVAAHACASLGVAMGATRADGAMRLEAVYCLGHCAVGPSGMLDQEPLALLDAAKLDALLAQALLPGVKP